MTNIKFMEYLIGISFCILSEILTLIFSSIPKWYSFYIEINEKIYTFTAGIFKFCIIENGDFYCLYYNINIYKYNEIIVQILLLLSVSIITIGIFISIKIYPNGKIYILKTSLLLILIGKILMIISIIYFDHIIGTKNFTDLISDSLKTNIKFITYKEIQYHECFSMAVVTIFMTATGIMLLYITGIKYRRY